MIFEALNSKPSFDEYHDSSVHTQRLRKYFDSPELGGPSFSEIQIGQRKIVTPLRKFIMAQQEAATGFFVIRKIKETHDSDVLHDLWLLSKGLTSEEKTHL